MDAVLATKRCSKCREIKPSFEFHSHLQTKDKLRTACKACTKSQNSKWKQKRKEARKCLNCDLITDGKTLCCACNEANNKYQQSVRDTRKALGVCEQCASKAEDGYVLCEVCWKAKQERSAKRYDEHQRADLCPGCGEPTKDSSRCDKCLAIGRSSRKILYETRKAEGKCFCGKPATQGKSRCRVCWLRQAAARWAGSPKAAKDIDRIWNEQDGLCALTGIRLAQGEASFDHVIPRSKGGSNEPSNLRWVHSVVNVMRGNRTDAELFAWCKRILNHTSDKRRKPTSTDSAQLRLAK